MAILSDLSVTGQGLPLWQEFTSAVTDTRRMQLITSKAIDSLCRRETPITTTVGVAGMRGSVIIRNLLASSLSEALHEWFKYRKVPQKHQNWN
jgi:hypothetical protein